MVRVRHVFVALGSALVCALCSGAKCGAILPTPPPGIDGGVTIIDGGLPETLDGGARSEEHTSELQSR